VTFTRQMTSAPARRVAGALLIGFAITVAYPTDAHAYLDPGTGSMIIQGVIAATAGSIYLLKVYWRKVKGLFARGSAEEAELAVTPAKTENS
jgi:hypothetical protein